MTQLNVFVSHSGRDKTACDMLVGGLRRAGADVWYDEHNLGAGRLLDEIQREVQARPIFIVLLSKAAFTSKWVRQETTWAFNLYNREPNRLILPVTIGPIEPSDFNGQWLFLEDFKRVEAPGHKPHTLAEAVERTLRLLELTPAGGRSNPATPDASEPVEDLLAKGKALSAQDRKAEALPFYERATQIAPNNSQAWFSLGLLHSQLNNYQKALDAYDHVLANNPGGGWLIWFLKASVLSRMKRYHEAILAYERALEINPNDDTFYVYKGSALFQLTRFPEALEVSERALAIRLDSASAWFLKGMSLDARGLHQEALVAFSRALEIEPDSPHFLRAKGLALRSLGKTEEAEEAERRAKALGG